MLLGAAWRRRWEWSADSRRIELVGPGCGHVRIGHGESPEADKAIVTESRLNCERGPEGVARRVWCSIVELLWPAPVRNIDGPTDVRVRSPALYLSSLRRYGRADGHNLSMSPVRRARGRCLRLEPCSSP